MSRPGVIITGGARRVGAAMALYFAGNGYDIALHYNRSAGEARKHQAEVKKLGADCQIFGVDLSDSKSLAPLMEKIHKAMPHCTALINSASPFERAPLMETDEAIFDRHFDVILKAPFFLTQAFAKHFGKGCVINMLDTDISKTYGAYFAYLLSKKALADFTVMAARSLGSAVRVNGVCPGIIMPPDDYDPAYQERTRGEMPMKNHPRIEEVAEAARWLIAQPHITGEIIFVDGGKHVL